MLQMVRHILPILIGVVVCSCNSLDIKGIFMPTGDGVEKRFEQSEQISGDLYAGSIDAQQSYIFYAATDPHIDQTHKNLDIFFDAFRNDSEASFGVILGDYTDKRDNLHKYLEATDFDPSRHSYDHKLFHILGNHDIFFNGWEDYRDMIGPSVYWFEVVFPEGKDLYITLDTATGSLGSRQTKWLKSFLTGNRHNYRHCIILTHTNFFYTDTSQASSGNLPIEESLALIDFFGKQNVTLVLQGHDHFREDLTYDNVRYTIIGTIQDESEAPEYLKASVNQDGIHFDWQLI